MSVPYNLTGAARKALVQTISEILGKPAVYQGAPTFTYAIDFYSVDKNGTLNYPDNTSPEDVRELVSRLRERGYTPENDNASRWSCRGRGFPLRLWTTSRKSSPAKRNCSSGHSARTQ